jgi:sarcosine oxidase subunit gamma
VAETSALTVSALAGLAVPGRLGAATESPGVVIRERHHLALATLIARSGQGDALAARIGEQFGLVLPRRPRRADAGSLAVIWSGPGQWLVLAESEAGHRLEARLRDATRDLASVSDQSAARVVLRLGGPRLRDALAKGLPLDLHPSAFGPGDTALSAAAFIGLQLWQLDDGPTYEVAVARSYARSFWHWLVAAAAEFGIEVLPAEPPGPGP